MDKLPTNSLHFTKAVAALGERCAVIASTAIYNRQGLKIVEQGAAINERLSERLLQHQLATPLQDSLGVERAVTGSRLRAVADTLLVEQPLFARMASNANTRRLLLDTLEALPLPAPIAFQLTLAYEMHPELFRHAVATAFTAAWLGMGPMVSRHDLSMLAAAGLLHDLGMLHVDPVLLQPTALLKREQRRQLYAHPLVSALLMQRHHEFSREAVRAVREHHEALDGSGYPGHLASAGISPWGCILSLAEVVAAVVEPGVGDAELRLSLLLRTNRHRYAPALIDRLLPLLQSLPKGVSPAASMGTLVTCLNDVDQVLGAWPSELMQDVSLPEQRRSGLAVLGEQCAMLRRTLADSGAAPGQLAMLEVEDAFGDLPVELALLAREAGWQLRTLTRQARRRWAASAGEPFPDTLGVWIERAEAVCETCSQPELAVTSARQPEPLQAPETA